MNEKNELFNLAPPGHTMMIDEGLPGGYFKDLLLTAGHLIESVKLGYGTAMLYNAVTLEYKAMACEEIAPHILLFTGGTLFEYMYLKGKAFTFIDWAAGRGFGGMEISNSRAGLSWDKIHDLARAIREAGLEPVLEIGSKFEPMAAADGSISKVWTASDWAEALTIATQIDHAAKIILEGRASGAGGIYYNSKNPRDEPIEALEAMHPDHADRWIIEAPEKSQQVEMIRRFGASIGLGNIRPGDVFGVAALRTSLRMDTFFLETDLPRS